jgi:hypothetical protein
MVLRPLRLCVKYQDCPAFLAKDAENAKLKYEGTNLCVLCVFV